MPTECLFCDAVLTGGVDTFGDSDEPLCVSCWLAFAEDRVVTTNHAHQCGLGFKAACEAKDWDKADFWYHERWAPIMDSPAGLVTRGFVSSRKEATHA